MLTSRTVVALAWLALGACSSDDKRGDSHPDAAVSGMGGADGYKGGNAGAGGSGDASPLASLFDDPTVPVCDSDGGKIVGRLAGQDVAFKVGFSSSISAGYFEFLSARGNEIVRPLSLSFLPRNLQRGVTSTLLGDSFWVPEDQPGGGRDYCILHGEFGPVPADEQPTDSNKAAFKFRIDRANAGADCSGGAVEVDLRGCIFRNNGLIPSGGTEPTPGLDAQECMPLSRRLPGALYNEVATSCDRDMLIPGLPNPTHFGSNDAVALLQPLVPGHRYAMNLRPNATSSQKPIVGEIWGQSSACGRVDELLWVGDLGDAKRFCIEYVPTQAHTHLLLVTRMSDTGIYPNLGALRFCDDGRCGGKLDGRGAEPGVTLTTVSGAYEYLLSASQNGTRQYRLGALGELLTVNADNGSSENLAGAAFRMGPNEPWGDRWYCASAGGIMRLDSGNDYDISVAGISRMPACDENTGSGTITVQWEKNARYASVTSSVPGFSGDKLEVSFGCGSSRCDGTLQGPSGTFHFFARVDGDLGPVNAATTAITLPISEATWLTAADRGGAIALDCGLRGAVMVSPSATEIQLTGVGTLAACGGSPTTPSSELFRLRW